LFEQLGEPQLDLPRSQTTAGLAAKQGHVRATVAFSGVIPKEPAFTESRYSS
jgi:hypothetical protein